MREAISQLIAIVCQLHQLFKLAGGSKRARKESAGRAKRRLPRLAAIDRLSSQRKGASIAATLRYEFSKQGKVFKALSAGKFTRDELEDD